MVKTKKMVLDVYKNRRGTVDSFVALTMRLEVQILVIGELTENTVNDYGRIYSLQGYTVLCLTKIPTW